MNATPLKPSVNCLYKECYRQFSIPPTLQNKTEVLVANKKMLYTLSQPKCKTQHYQEMLICKV